MRTNQMLFVGERHGAYEKEHVVHHKCLKLQSSWTLHLKQGYLHSLGEQESDNAGSMGLV